MSRAFNLTMTEAEVVQHCRAEKIGISALESLPDGGMRLVCMSGYDAGQIRRKLKRYIIEGEVRRERFRPRHSSW